MSSQDTQTQCAPMCIMLTSRDMQRSIGFYRDTLGFTLKEAWPDAKAPMWCSLLFEGQVVMLGAMMKPEQAAQMCGGDEGAATYMRTLAEEFQKNQAGVGIVTYIKVADVDGYHAQVVKRGLKGASAPKSQFYGLREFAVQDPDGYRFLFYTPIVMTSCQSCGMPMTDAQPGVMYCKYCLDEKGKLRPYEQVLEGTTTGYFMQMQKLPRDKAVVAAKEHLAKMPAWVKHK